MKEIIITKERQFSNYKKGTFLGGSEDMAHNKFDAYRVDDEIHLVYESGHAMIEKINTIKNNMDGFLWTPFVMFVSE